ncbi:chorismate-binding protein [uncultured Prochlorococcus sp.]|uniref:chorismate-binding protein n=1 Tax=uncultured Prochlorococcus sp. TaxID=159733 RepID=UPI002587785F|nr:chorismate-binding protein [uncultured Prochlorococcus sp.]
MSKFSSQEIESQYNLIKTLLFDPEKYKDSLDAIKKDIAYMPLELKKKLEEENITL